MKTTIVAAATAMLFAAPAFAWEGQVVECYGKVWSPAEHSVKHKLEKHEKWMWEHRNGQLTKVYYAPVYSEVKTKTKDGYWIMRPEPCN